MYKCFNEILDAEGKYIYQLFKILKENVVLFNHLVAEIILF